MRKHVIGYPGFFAVVVMFLLFPRLIMADVIETDLGVVHYSQAPKTWSVSIPENFQKVEIAVYQKADGIPSQYNGWQAYMKINGRDTWKFLRFDEKLGGIVYDYTINQEVREKEGKNKYLDVTGLISAGENAITYYHYNEGEGLGVKIRIHTAKKTSGNDLFKDFFDKKTDKKGWLGVTIQDVTPDIAKSLGLSDARGALVSDVMKGSPAEKAGINRGDIILEFNRKSISMPAELRDAVIESRPNDKALLLIHRSGGKLFLSIILEAQPADYAEKVGKEPAAMDVLTSGEKLPPFRFDTYAVVIGIDYRGRQDIPNLQYPSQDAKKVYDILTDPKYGGVPKENAVILLNEKATRNEMISALRKVKNWDGYVYVYFSGHGAPKTKEDKFVDAYLVPYDVVITDPEAMEDTSIKVSYLQDLIDASQAKGIMVALDACFTGGGKSIVPKGGKPLVLMGTTAELMKLKGAGKVIITSSAMNQQSWEDESEIKGGIFSYFLLEGLKGKAGKNLWVKVNELSDYIKENVPKSARKLKGVDQNPQVSGKGDFAVTRNWEKSQVMDIEMARSKLKNAFEKGYVTAEQLNKALDELKSASRSKTLEAFLEGKIDEKKFGELY